MKICTKCKESKGLSEFGKQATGLNGLRSVCKKCHNLDNKKYRKEHPEVRAKYRSENKEKIAITTNEYYVNNSIVIKERSAMWYLNNIEYACLQQKGYRIENHTLIKDKKHEHYVNNSETILQKQKQDRKENPDKFNARNAKRRAAKLQRVPVWLTKEDFKTITAIYKEARTLTESTGIQHHVDHIIPLLGKNVSGFHCPKNLQILTATENMKKKNKF